MLVGDGATGKTSFAIVSTGQSFPTEYIPTVFDNTETELTLPVVGRTNLVLWDTAGQEGYSRLRALSYPDADVFLICFSVTKRSSFENVMHKWVPEVRHHVPAAALVLVGLQADGAAADRVVSFESAVGMSPSSLCAIAIALAFTMQADAETASSIGAFRYVECSALDNRNVGDVLQAAVLAVTAQQQPARMSRKKSSRCAVL